MLRVSQEVKDAFLSGAEKQLTVALSDGTTLTNESIISESFSMTQTLCDEQQIKYGSIASASFKLKTYAVNRQFKGKTATISISCDNQTIQLGIFIIEEDKISDDRRTKQISGYDRLYTAMRTDCSGWYSSLSFPIRAKAFRISLFNFLGIPQEDIDLPNDTALIYRTMESDEANSIGGQETITRLCEMNARMGYLDNQGIFRYVKIGGENQNYPAEDNYPSEENYPAEGSSDTAEGATVVLGSLVYEDYASRPITKVQIKEEDEDRGVIVGQDGNAYIINGNFLLYGNTRQQNETIARNFLEELAHTFYHPAKVKCRAMPWMQPGDMIRITTRTQSLAFPILTRQMEGITALYDTFQAKGNEYFSFNFSGTGYKLEQLRSRTLVLKANLDEVSSTLTEKIEEQGQIIADNYSTIQQTINQVKIDLGNATTHAAIVAKINDNTSSVLIQADKIDLSGYATFKALRESGQTVINGGNVSTGRITGGKTYFDVDKGVFRTSEQQYGMEIRQGILVFTDGAGNVKGEIKYVPSSQALNLYSEWINIGTKYGLKIQGFPVTRTSQLMITGVGGDTVSVISGLTVSPQIGYIPVSGVIDGRAYTGVAGPCVTNVIASVGQTNVMQNIRTSSVTRWFWGA